MNWDKREQRFKRFNGVFLVIYIVATLLILWQGIGVGDQRAVLYSLISLVMLLLPPVVEKTWRIIIPADSRFFFYVFCFGAIEVGSAMDVYEWIAWWDLLLHGISGALMAFVGLLLFNVLRRNGGKIPKDEWKLAVIFMNLAATTSAVLWEYYEFALDTFLGFESQYSALGVSDTMTDMLVCTVGGVCLSMWFYWCMKRHKNNLFLNAADHFYWRNQRRGKQ